MRAGTNCYYFSDLAGREKDWKNAMKQCQKMGGALAEMETIEENQDVVAHIQANSNLRGRHYIIPYIVSTDRHTYFVEIGKEYLCPVRAHET